MHKIYNMKKITLVLLLLLVFFNTNAQDILSTVTKEVCACVETKKDKLQGLTPDKLQAQLGLCILASYTAHETEIKVKYGEILNNDKAMEKFGEEIGLKMSTVCPETLLEFAGVNVDDAESEVLSVEGKITEIKNEQFTTILVKDKNGRVYSFLVLNYFDTASLVSGDELNKNNSVIIKYSEVELYDNKAKEFRFYKIVSGIEKK
jgi:thymidine phosphorylase